MKTDSGKKWVNWALGLGAVAVAIHIVALVRYGGNVSAAGFSEALSQALVAILITIGIHLVAGLISTLGLGFAVLATRKGAQGRSFIAGWTLNALSMSFGLYIAVLALADWLSN